MAEEATLEGKAWLDDGSCLRLRPERANHVWEHDFVESRTHDRRKLRMFCVVDEVTREALAIRVERTWPTFRLAQNASQHYH